MLPVILPLLFACSTTVASVPPGTYDPTHDTWNQVLRKNVQNGQVNYTAIRANKAELDSYLGELAATTPGESWSKNEAFAFWLNAYNAWTVRLIVDHPEIKSIKDITLLSPWKITFIPMQALGQSALSLDDIEHKILRTQFPDPRIHMAVVCASTSCPALRAEAYVGDRLENQLYDQARVFLADPTKNTLDTANKELKLSSIFKWYEGDFASKGGVLGFVQAYGSREMAKAAAEGWKVSYLDYDWGLNGK